MQLCVLIITARPHVLITTHTIIILLLRSALPPILLQVLHYYTPHHCPHHSQTMGPTSTTTKKYPCECSCSHASWESLSIVSLCRCVTSYKPAFWRSSLFNVFQNRLRSRSTSRFVSCPALPLLSLVVPLAPPAWPSQFSVARSIAQALLLMLHTKSFCESTIKAC